MVKKYNYCTCFITELTEHSPIIIQNGSSNPSSKKIWTYDRTTIQPYAQGATFNMRGQMVALHL